VDGSLLVVEQEKTTEDEIRKAMDLLKDKPVFGTVLNKTMSAVS
jgi:Mrp family chromosome partitioning ATPase